jgi:hypothetical protein
VRVDSLFFSSCWAGNIWFGVCAESAFPQNRD